MKTDYVWILALAILPFLLRFVLYWLAFRIRSIRIKLLSCLVIAGSAYFLVILPLPLPREISFVLTVGLVIFLITRYTEADLFPDALLIALSIELVSILVLDFLTIPLIPR